MTIRSKALRLWLVIFAGTTGLAQAALTGPNMIRYSVDETFTATGVAPDATGRAQVLDKKDGEAGHQRLRVTVAHLDPRTSYTLLAEAGDTLAVITISEFTTTGLGRGIVSLSENAVLTRRGLRKTAAGRRALPEGLSPLTEVRSLMIADPSGQVVLTVALHESAAMSFALTSVFENTGNDPEAIGCLAVACQNGSVQFRLFAAGQSSQFTFCVNDSPVGTYQADYTGRISIGAFPHAAPSPLLFQKLCVRNAGNAVVLQSNVR